MIGPVPMHVVTDNRRIPDALVGGIVVIGNFDGVHRGHQQVIGQARRSATTDGLPLTVMTFEPHSREFFAPEAPPIRLTPFSVKRRLLEGLGIDLLLALPFDRAFSKMSADAFVEEILVDRLAANHVVVGYDFAFGHKRSGNVDKLRESAAKHGFAVTVVDPVANGGLVYSSSRIRDCLWQGAPDQAAHLLGHWWEVEGVVVTGDKRGRQLGFPTANFDVTGYIEPAFGVYAVRLGWVEDGQTVWHDGVANLGRRPTFGKTNAVLEVHLLDFSGDLYGRTCRVAFTEFLRSERKFDGLDSLKAQIAEDTAKAKRCLSDPKNAIDSLELEALDSSGSAC